MRHRASSPFTFALLGALAFMCACVAHEAVGHGGACLLTGGRVELLTSVYFRCKPGNPFTDAAGPLLNVAVALVSSLALKYLRLSAIRSTTLALIFGFNALWGTGYFVFSAVTNTGDWAFVLRDLKAQPLWLWRLAMGVVGVAAYGASLVFLSRHLERGIPLICAYLAAGVVACVSVMPFGGPLVPALREAAQESLVASAGLLYLALARHTSNFGAMGIALGSPSKQLVAIVTLALLVFWSTLGRGFGVA